MENVNIQNIFEQAQKDPTLLSTMDIDKLLETIENNKNDYLENKTSQSITEDIFNKLNELDMQEEEIKNTCNKLIGYRHVDEIHELHKGKHIRWIRLNGKTLTNGGMLVDIKFLDNGTHILCRNGNRFIQYKFDECSTFQKMSTEEQVILMAYDYIDRVKPMVSPLPPSFKG
jgi:NDP-sugar pyrophosphorylase family protein